MVHLTPLIASGAELRLVQPAQHMCLLQAASVTCPVHHCSQGCTPPANVA